MNYYDLGFNKFLTKPILGNTSDSFLDLLNQYQTGAIGSSIISDAAINNEKINYSDRGFSAVVDISGKEQFKDIQQAVDYVDRNGGGRILIKEGTYTLTSDILLESKISLIGEGSTKTIIDCNGDRSIKKVGDFGTDFSNLVGYSDDALQNISIENLAIKNSTDTSGAVIFQYIRNVTIKNCYFKDNTVDVLLSICMPAIIDSCTSYSSGTGFTVSGGWQTISNCIIAEATTNGIVVSGGGTANTISVINNIVSGACSDSGIYVNGGDNATIIGNLVTDVDVTGIKVTGSSAPFGVKVIGNSITDGNSATGYAIIFSKGSYCVMADNNIDVGYATGIAVDNCDNCRMIGNGVRLNNAASSRGLVVSANADRTIYDGNDIEDSATPVTDSGSNSVAGDNVTS